MSNIFNSENQTNSVGVNSSKKKEVVITKETTKRFIKDVRDVMRHPLLTMVHIIYMTRLIC